jgi:hypothetical protein
MLKKGTNMTWLGLLNVQQRCQGIGSFVRHKHFAETQTISDRSACWCGGVVRRAPPGHGAESEGYGGGRDAVARTQRGPNDVRATDSLSIRLSRSSPFQILARHATRANFLQPHPLPLSNAIRATHRPPPAPPSTPRTCVSPPSFENEISPCFRDAASVPTRLLGSVSRTPSFLPAEPPAPVLHSHAPPSRGSLSPPSPVRPCGAEHLPHTSPRTRGKRDSLPMWTTAEQ